MYSAGLHGSSRNLTDVNDNYEKEVSKAAEIGFKSYLARPQR